MNLYNYGDLLCAPIWGSATTCANLCQASRGPLAVPSHEVLSKTFTESGLTIFMRVEGQS